MASESKKTRVTFKILAPLAQQVFLAGSFNNWDPSRHSLKRSKIGVWQKALYLAPGTHEYKFVVDGIWVEDDTCERKFLNPFGQYNSAVHII
ncbi:MAG: glycoside hydrolase [Syntrophus sp. (in: bacteria)]|nr:glycoside hydrolase [Syntrophus sp. (in: bacteria)]